MKKHHTIIIMIFCLPLYGLTEDSTITYRDSAGPRPFQYDKDAGLQYKNGGFTVTTWAFAERLLADYDQKALWRRVRQGMEIKFPAYSFRIHGNKLRTAFTYEIDFTNNNFFKDKPLKIWENLFLSFQNADDPIRFKILFGENTHILSREDNLSSGNLTTINRSLILEQHGSVNNFGTQWGLQVQKLLKATTFLQFGLQDNRGSLNQDHPRFQFWNDASLKLTKFLFQPSDSSRQSLNLGMSIDYTRNIKKTNFSIASGLYQKALGATPATGNKMTFENNIDYTNHIGSHFYAVEYEAIYSQYSDQKLIVGGGYVQAQFQIFDLKRVGEMVPFLRYDAVDLFTAGNKVKERVIKLGLNYNLPFTDKLINIHLEYDYHSNNNLGNIFSYTDKRFNEFRLELRANTIRYRRF